MIQRIDWTQQPLEMLPMRQLLVALTRIRGCIRNFDISTRMVKTIAQKKANAMRLIRSHKQSLGR
eukprot:10370384-Karenia_brevis.AAC.1